ncbi:hypothetical protein PGTUg99_031503 [Puccinia graminis f. sp. tritici]|uniref:Uncharacterized protein n=1 Tax=Puccinia graminis f. sp. tritici TaxID=56615 RepID=A0A5B0PQY0_PUCGR|nr:hypothetical protein PGTUg99_031503 [Puccinia graminis f. sp. tritici]
MVDYVMKHAHIPNVPPVRTLTQQSQTSSFSFPTNRSTQSRTNKPIGTVYRSHQVAATNQFRYISVVLRTPPSTLHLSLLVLHVQFDTKSILLIASLTYQDCCKIYLPLKSYQSITVAMTRTKRKHLLRALKRDGPLPLGGPDRLTMGNSINRQGHKGACAVIQPALKTATCIDGRSESPLSLGNTDLLARRKANNHQGYKEACVVSLPINKDASLPATGPLPTSSLDILEKRQDNKPQLQKKKKCSVLLYGTSNVPQSPQTSKSSTAICICYGKEDCEGIQEA